METDRWRQLCPAAWTPGGRGVGSGGAVDDAFDFAAVDAEFARARTLVPVVEPRPWLRTLVNNQFIQQYRSETRKKRGGMHRIDSLDRHREKGLDPPCPAPDPAETVADQDLQVRLRAAINDLPSALRAVTELMLEGHTHREIAKILGIPENTSKTRLRAVVKHLRGISGLASE